MFGECFQFRNPSAQRLFRFMPPCLFTFSVNPAGY
jgi:hypothetical protein